MVKFKYCISAILCTTYYITDYITSHKIRKIYEELKTLSNTARRIKPMQKQSANFIFFILEKVADRKKKPQNIRTQYPIFRGKHYITRIYIVFSNIRWSLCKVKNFEHSISCLSKCIIIRAIIITFEKKI